MGNLFACSAAPQPQSYSELSLPSRPTLSDRGAESRRNAAVSPEHKAGMLARLSASESELTTDIEGLSESRAGGRLTLIELNTSAGESVSVQCVSVAEGLTLDSDTSARDISLSPGTSSMSRPVVRRLSNSTAEVIIGEISATRQDDGSAKYSFKPAAGFVGMVAIQTGDSRRVVQSEVAAEVPAPRPERSVTEPRLDLTTDSELNLEPPSLQGEETRVGDREPETGVAGGDSTREPVPAKPEQDPAGPELEVEPTGLATDDGELPAEEPLSDRGEAAGGSPETSLPGRTGNPRPDPAGTGETRPANFTSLGPRPLPEVAGDSTDFELSTDGDPGESSPEQREAEEEFGRHNFEDMQPAAEGESGIGIEPPAAQPEAESEPKIEPVTGSDNQSGLEAAEAEESREAERKDAEAKPEPSGDKQSEAELDEPETGPSDRVEADEAEADSEVDEEQEAKSEPEVESEAERQPEADTDRYPGKQDPSAEGQARAEAEQEPKPEPERGPKPEEQTEVDNAGAEAERNADAEPGAEDLELKRAEAEAQAKLEREAEAKAAREREQREQREATHRKEIAAFEDFIERFIGTGDEKATRGFRNAFLNIAVDEEGTLGSDEARARTAALISRLPRPDFGETLRNPSLGRNWIRARLGGYTEEFIRRAGEVVQWRPGAP